jgi:hypothetical protein
MLEGESHVRSQRNGMQIKWNDKMLETRRKWRLPEGLQLKATADVGKNNRSAGH